ncbi:hypothetical protein GCM10027174_45850 [Salinifilum aidingensis]
MSREPSCRQCRLNAIGQWLGWHLLELTAVGIPLALAITVSTWWWGLAVLAGALWLGHEIHLSRSQPAERTRSAVTAGPESRAVPAATKSTPSTSETASNASESSKEASA